MIRKLILAGLFLGSILSLSARAEVEPLSRDLDGVAITYTYSDGSKFNVQYTPKGIRYRFLSGESPDQWWGPFPYKAFKTKNSEYFVGWYEKGYGDSITQLVNLRTLTLYGSGIIVKKKGKVIEHFDKAKIEKIEKI